MMHNYLHTDVNRDVTTGDSVSKDEVKELKTLLKEKEKVILEKEERILEKDIEITTLKDEIEVSGKNNEKKAEEIEILIASVNSLEEETSIIKCNFLNECKKVEKLNNTLKKVYKEKEVLQKKDASNGVQDDTDNDKNGSSLKKKLMEKQKEITVLKERNKKLGDDLA